MLWTLLKIGFAVGVTVILYYVGATIVRGFALPPRGDGEGDDEGQVHPVDLRFECVVCGALVTMTASPHDDPAPPRHCMEEMHLVADFSSE
ncbi:MAG: hypothetical protein HYU28_10250 [Actinobacteria bacterium]|nr:hypothetical protein [Actinomycetota bacterium]